MSCSSHFQTIFISGLTILILVYSITLFVAMIREMVTQDSCVTLTICCKYVMYGSCIDFPHTLPRRKWYVHFINAH